MTDSDEADFRGFQLAQLVRQIEDECGIRFALPRLDANPHCYLLYLREVLQWLSRPMRIECDGREMSRRPTQ